MEEPQEESQQVVKVLEALKQASHDLQTNPSPDSPDSNSSAICALLELETESKSLSFLAPPVMEEVVSGIEPQEESQQVVKVLEALKQASHDLQTNPSPNSPDSNSSAIRALLELETESKSLSFLAPPVMEEVVSGVEPQEDSQQVVKVLEALKQASHDLQTNPSPNSPDSNSSAIRALLELETESKSLLLSDPYLSSLSRHLSNLRSILESFDDKTHGLGLRSFLTRRVSTHEISRVAGSIQSEIQAWIDRQNVEALLQVLNQSPQSDDETIMKTLGLFVDRLGQGFNRELQDLILKSNLFSRLEVIICDLGYSNEVREQVALTIAELIRFNKDVFVGQVLMGDTTGALISMPSTSSLQVLCLLIKSIKSPLVDELDNKGDIPKIVGFLKFNDLAIKMMAMNCVLEIGYYGRKEAVEAMLMVDLIKTLVEMQRSELGGDLIEMGKWEKKRRGSEKRFLESHPFASCVARFAVQLEVGEGLRQREKRAFKQEVLKRVRDACLSDAEAATIVAEVLWGSSP